MKTPEMAAPPVEAKRATAQRIPADGWRALYQDGTVRPLVVWQFDDDRGVGIVADGADLVPADRVEGFKRYVYRGEK